jgi:hypothetical protein
MSVTPTRLQTLGAAMIGTLALGACDDPVADTDLRPEGPPEVLAVLVFNDTTNNAVESATYCKPNDPKRPGKVGLPAYGLNPIICPLDGSPVEELTDAWPDAWYLRIVFDELLDPDVETLEPVLDAMGNETDMATGSLAATQPVILKCQGVNGMMVNVEYDGYYSPSGNTVTWPLGPSLVIQPLDPTVVPVGSECEVTLKESVKDKQGNSVPAGDRDPASPFKFKIAPVSVIAAVPGDGDKIDPAIFSSTSLPLRRVVLDLNVEVEGGESFCTDKAMATCFSLASADQTVADPARPTVEFVALGAPAGDGRLNAMFISADLLGGEDYTFKAPQEVRVKDKCGVPSTVAGLPSEFTFSTNAARFVSFNPGGGNAVAPSKKITLTFNQVIDLSSFTSPDDYEITPSPANLSLATAALGTQIRFNGDYNLNTSYKLTLKNGATIKDNFGQQTITLTENKVTDFTTAAAIAITAQSPVNGGRITKAMPTSNVRVSLTFNQEMVAGSITASEYTLAKADGSPVTIAPAITTSGAALRFDFPGLPAGAYKFTLKQGATVEDKISPPNVYPQMVDKVINFTVEESGPDQPFKCLGAP